MALAAPAAPPAAPPTVESVYRTLCECVDAGSAAERAAAEAVLMRWEVAGLPTALVRVAEGVGAAREEARLLAVLVLKNGVGSSVRKLVGTREWERVAGPEQDEVRRALERMALAEPSERVAVQLALLVANVARVDYPDRWPHLVRGLLGAAAWANGQTPPEQKDRALRVLKHTLSAVASRSAFMRQRLLGTGSVGNTHQAAVQDSFEPLASEWEAHAAAAASGGPDAGARAGLAVRCAQAMRPLFAIVPSLQPLHVGFDIGRLFQTFLPHLTAAPAASAVAAKHRRLLAECATLALDSHPADFAPMLGPFVRQLMEAILALPADALAADPKWALILTRFLARALLCPLYDPARVEEELGGASRAGPPSP
eukprot:CAMPEP_0183808506 /NCGR_PEP_ID=MMETSP0803_2-20130417/43761_1 /TAXON_ID=195967 /ORGANISM="Crustomastix stigmata, Strain CCMP3273" /LENGTH=369 /DNA_ID=CAMNT_0026053303 /DNA_START=54 /DNA_END=1159 /DNA_ORIENTATION=-